MNLDEGELSKKIMEEQIKMKFPGLAIEAQQYIKEFELPDITDKNAKKLSSISWKIMVKKAIKQKCEKYFVQKWPDNKKLIETMKDETNILK